MRVRDTNRLHALLHDLAEDKTGNPCAGSVQFAASGNFADHEVNPVKGWHWQLAWQSEQQPFLEHFLEFVPALL